MKPSQNCVEQEAYEGVSKSFRTESITKYTPTFAIARWEATRRVMAAKITRLIHKIAIQLHLVAESYTICSSRSRRPVRKLLDTPFYTVSFFFYLFIFFLFIYYRDLSSPLSHPATWETCHRTLGTFGASSADALVTFTAALARDGKKCALLLVLGRTYLKVPG
jgi:hypothetical protein